MAYDDILEKLKKLGRRGDTNLRNVQGELSHVNELEASLIDNHGPLGELLTREIGSGTINPSTGLREYNWTEDNYLDQYQYYKDAKYDDWTDDDQETYDDYKKWLDEQDDPYKDVLSDELDEMDVGIGIDSPISGWDEFKDLDPSQLLQFDPDQMHSMSEELTDMEIRKEDFFKYMPQYDERGEESIRQSRRYARGAEARQGQTELLELAQSKYGQQSRSGFASTGNPMIDKQRQDLQTDIAQSTAQAEFDFGQEIYDYQEDYQQQFGERLIAYEDRIEKKNSKGGGGGTCVLSTAAYKQGLITSDELMSFVNWRLKTQHKEFLGHAKWIGYQIAWKPISKLMLKYKWFAKLVKKLILDKWLNVINNKGKHRITKFFVEYTGVVGLLFNPGKAKKLKKRLKKLGLKGILRSYKTLIMTKNS